ncbi:DUF2283 domain-containing protein [Candidatus Pacearchaeota archaeon]|nr:DUF2283 domain-containing protein [Candidatus Pacearchaeota archaeon]
MESKIFYDEEYDNLIISQKADNEKVKKNFLFDNITISLTGAGKVVAIEVMDASKYLSEIGFDANLLEDITKANLIVKPKKDFVFIGFQIVSTKKSSPQRVPLATIPVSCMH